MKQRILLTGGSGLVGSNLCNFLDVMTPTHDELDITRIDQVRAYFAKHKPSVVIHAAAYTHDVPREQCWKVNVLGTKNIDTAAKAVGAFHIFISTGSVFSGQGPFTEDDKPNSSKLSWYAWTKRVAERSVHGAIIRISHPLYIERLGKSSAFYNNVRFPLTSMSDLARAIIVLIKKPRPGIYHVASPDFVSPWELMNFYTGKINKTSNSEQQYPAIAVIKTQKRLGLRFKPWKQAVAEEFASPA